MNKITRARIEWKLPDLWVGAFWKTTYAQTDAGRLSKFTDVWVCLLPCVPIHVTIEHQIAIPMAMPITWDDCNCAMNPNQKTQPCPFHESLKNENRA